MLGLLSYLRTKRLRQAINSSSLASDPAGLRLSESKLRRLCPTLYFTSSIGGLIRCFFRDGLGTREFIRDMPAHGDSRAAIVVRSCPLLVACYCDDSDAVCVLEFQKSDLGVAEPRAGDRLLTVLNSFTLKRPARAGEVAVDLVQGDAANPYYINFWPLIAEFISGDTDEIERRKAAILDNEYERCRALGEEHLKRLAGKVRDGRPDRSRYPAL